MRNQVEDVFKRQDATANGTFEISDRCSNSLVNSVLNWEGDLKGSR
jgi:hypothetical protein